MSNHTNKVYSSLHVAAITLETYEGEIVLMDNKDGDEIFVMPSEEAQMQDIGYRRKTILDSAFWYRTTDKNDPNLDNWFGPYESEVEMTDAIDEAYLGDNGPEESYSLKRLPMQRAASDVTSVLQAGLDDFVGGTDESIVDLLGVDDPDFMPQNFSL